MPARADRRLSGRNLLIAKGALLAQQQTAIEVVKTGFEAVIAQEGAITASFTASARR